MAELHPVKTDDINKEEEKEKLIQIIKELEAKLVSLIYFLTHI